MKKSLTDLVYETKEAYSNLQALQPNHELLKYFIINGKQFGLNPDIKLKKEFIGRFGGINPKGFMTFSDYEIAVVQKTFGNYTSTLEEAVRVFIEG